jgi:hypothetical protein
VSFDPDTLRALCVICADGHISLRGTAQRLLAHELASRLRGSNLDYNPNGDHPAFVDDAQPDFVAATNVVGLVELRAGGLDIAEFYFYNQSGQWSGTKPHDPVQGYAALLADLVAEAGPMIDEVRTPDGVPDGWLDAVRHRLRGVAQAGAAFPSQEVFSFTTVSGTNPNGDPIASRIRATSVVLGAGSWRVQVSAKVRSIASAIGADVGFAIKTDAFATLTQIQPRTPATSSDQSDVVTQFDVSIDIVISSGTKVLTIANPTSDEEQIDGILRFWQL